MGLDLRQRTCLIIFMCDWCLVVIDSCFGFWRSRQPLLIFYRDDKNMLKYFVLRCWKRGLFQCCYLSWHCVTTRVHTARVSMLSILHWLPVCVHIHVHSTGVHIVSLHRGVLTICTCAEVSPAEVSDSQIAPFEVNSASGAASYCQPTSSVYKRIYFSSTTIENRR